jgi:hypothetical protein
MRKTYQELIILNKVVPRLENVDFNNNYIIESTTQWCYSDDDASTIFIDVFPSTIQLSNFSQLVFLKGRFVLFNKYENTTAKEGYILEDDGGKGKFVEYWGLLKYSDQIRQKGE